MGRDDIPVGLGYLLALNQSDPTSPSVGDCLYAKAIPQGCGGFLDSDTLYGLARDLPRSARRYLNMHCNKLYAVVYVFFFAKFFYYYYYFVITL